MDSDSNISYLLNFAFEKVPGDLVGFVITLSLSTLYVNGSGPSREFFSISSKSETLLDYLENMLLSMCDAF